MSLLTVIPAQAGIQTILVKNMGSNTAPQRRPESVTSVTHPAALQAIKNEVLMHNQSS